MDCACGGGNEIAKCGSFGFFFPSTSSVSKYRELDVQRIPDWVALSAASPVWTMTLAEWLAQEELADNALVRTELPATRSDVAPTGVSYWFEYCDAGGRAWLSSGPSADDCCVRSTHLRQVAGYVSPELNARPDHASPFKLGVSCHGAVGIEVQLLAITDGSS